MIGCTVHVCFVYRRRRAVAGAHSNRDCRGREGRSRDAAREFQIHTTVTSRSRNVHRSIRGDQEARVIALRLGPPPKGYANWTLRLLARKVVELELVESISHETIRQTLKKTG